MHASLARLWEDILRGDPATDHVVALLVLVSLGFGLGAVLLFNGITARRKS